MIQCCLMCSLNRWLKRFTPQGDDKMGLLTRPEAGLKYGEIINGDWKDQDAWLIKISLPSGLSVTYEGSPVTHVTCNRDMAIPLFKAFSNVVSRGLAGEFKTYGGCFNIRPVRGVATQFSWHSYGLAIDINPETNALGTIGTMSPELVKCFTDSGFVWGGDFHSRKDFMHFQYALG